MNTDSQTKLILRHLAKGHSLTPLEALRRFDCLRLGARAWDLKRAGWPVESKIVTKHGKRVAEYSIPKAQRR
jgi:hypothetical protein